METTKTIRSACAIIGLSLKDNNIILVNFSDGTTVNINSKNREQAEGRFKHLTKTTHPLIEYKEEYLDDLINKPAFW